jgi:hypothetical protein
LPNHAAHSFEIQFVNLFKQARSAITTDQYDRIKNDVRKLAKAAYDAGRSGNKHLSSAVCVGHG